MREVSRDSKGKVRGISQLEMHNSINHTKLTPEQYKHGNPHQLGGGNGYPHGVVWINGKDIKDADALIMDTGDECYEFWARQRPVRIPRTSKYIEWKHLFDFHNYELEELALNVLERIPDEVYEITKKTRVQ
jgi:hypothetical protein